MTTMPSLTATSASASPTRTLRSAVSTTHGPAMRTGMPPPPTRGAMSVGELAERAGGPGAAAGAGLPLPVIQRGAHEPGEQRGRAHGPRFELGGELAADEPGMIRELDHLDQRAVGRQSRAAPAILADHVAVGRH